MFMLCITWSALAFAEDPQLRMAIAAQQSGDIPLAEYYLEDLLMHQDLPKSTREQAVKMLVEVYWVQGKDKTLLDFAERHLGERPMEFWWCRILERRGDFHEAAVCWDGLGEISRMERSIRSATLVDELAPPKSFVGRRRD
jgi:hypothetical protein